MTDQHLLGLLIINSSNKSIRSKQTILNNGPRAKNRKCTKGNFEERELIFADVITWE